MILRRWLAAFQRAENAHVDAERPAPVGRGRFVGNRVNEGNRALIPVNLRPEKVNLKRGTHKVAGMSTRHGANVQSVSRVMLTLPVTPDMPKVV